MAPTVGNILVTKIAGVVLEVKHVPKRGYNAHHKYDYVTESDMVEALRDSLAKANVVMVPSYEHIETIKTDKGLLVTIRGTFTFTDGTDKYDVRTIGSGYDIPGDKAVYKAMTGAQKYALKQLFLIPTGDDPERDGDEVSKDVGSNRGSEQAGGGTTSSATARTSVGMAARDAGKDEGSGQPARGGRASEATVTFGKNKGKKLSDLSDSDLAWWTKMMEESVAKNDERWHEKNKANFAACQTEWARRQPWRQAWSQILDRAKLFGLDKDGTEAILKEELHIDRADLLTNEHVVLFDRYLAQLEDEESGER